MCNITLRHVRKTVAMKKHEVLHILSVYLHSCFSYLPYKAHVPYYVVICGLTASTLSHKHDFQEKIY
jgi:hypothetical protein